jgi:hypothetical protein
MQRCRFPAKLRVTSRDFSCSHQPTNSSRWHPRSQEEGRLFNFGHTCYWEGPAKKRWIACECPIPGRVDFFSSPAGSVHYSAGILDGVERKFALDLLAYLSEKRLWRNTLVDDPLFYADKLYRSLRRSDSPFIPYPFDVKHRHIVSSARVQDQVRDLAALFQRLLSETFAPTPPIQI